MSEQKNSPETEPKVDELRDLEPRPATDQADGSDTDVKGGRKAGGGQQDYLNVTMKDALIS